MHLRAERADSCTVEQPEWHTLVMAALALASAVFSVLVDGPSPQLFGLLAIALIPWALVVAGIRIPLWLFVIATLFPAALAVLIPAPGPIFFGVATVLFVTSQTRDRGLTFLAVGGALSLPLLCAFTNGQVDASGNWYFAAGILFGWFAGHLILRQYELVADLRTAQNQVSELATEAERRRIAREIHDIVAHSLTVVLLNVGGARKAMEVDPGEATAALERAEMVGRQALDDIRHTVGLLRDDDPIRSGSATAATPTAVALPALIEGYRAAGLDVDYQVDGPLGVLDPVNSTTLYRFVQEGLANVLVHAPGATASVTVLVDPHRLEASVRNGASDTEGVTATDREGLGLIGMRERIESRRGRFGAGPDRGGWLVECSLPLVPAAQRVAP